MTAQFTPSARDARSYRDDPAVPPFPDETNILLEDGRAWLKSVGTLRMAQGLGAPWSFVVVLRILPRALLDRLYGLMARNRLKRFGTRETCYRPDPRYADRFL